MVAKCLCIEQVKQREIEEETKGSETQKER